METKYRDSQWDKNGVLRDILKDIRLPKMARIRQHFITDRVEDIGAAVKEEARKLEVEKQVKPGQRIAITAGSRGVDNLAEIIREVALLLKSLDCIPFVVPAMGSHGGATAQGQIEILESLGVTEESVGVQILSSMDVVQIATTDDGRPVYLDKNAWEADGIVVLNRIKAHCSFRGDFESGLYKMLAIGLGKQKGAESIHADGFGNMGGNIPMFGNKIVEKANILFGVAIIENGYDKIYKIEMMKSEDIRTREPQLLLESKDGLPRIYFDNFDVLVVDQIGKNISGDGMDANITGKFTTPYASGGPDVQKYVALDVDPHSHGNVIGVGLSDFTTKRLFDKTDFDAGYPNALTCRVTHGIHMPMVLKNDATAIAAAIYCCIDINHDAPRIVRIRNTSLIEDILISEALFEEAKAHPNVEILAEPTGLVFDSEGNLL